MNKQQLLELEKSAHLSVAELRKKRPALAKTIDDRLEERVKRAAVASLAGGSEKLRKVAETIKLRLGATPDKTKLREATLKALREAVAKDKKLAGDEGLKKELDELEKASARPVAPTGRPDVTLADSLRFDDPVAFNPEFLPDLDAARIYRLSDAVGLGDGTAKTLVDNVGSVTEISSDRLEALVKEKKLDRGEAKAAGFASSLYHLLDERPDLVAAATTGITGVHELVKNDEAAWTKFIKQSKTKPPAGISAEEYAGLLAKKVARLFPTDALAHRLSQVRIGDILKEHAGLAELRSLNPNSPVVGARDFDALKKDGIASAELRKLKVRYESVVRLVNRYAAMRLAALLDNDSLSEREKGREVTRRSELVNAFFAENDEVLGVDLTHGSDELKALKFADGASDADKAMVLATGRTYQRMMAVTEDVGDAEALVVGGYPSSLAVAASGLDMLVAKTGLKQEVAERYQEKAKRIASGVTAHVGSVIDIVKGDFKNIAVGNISPALSGYLKEIPGFADFFGNQDYCNCKHCQSILSPAAYFVDMMCFVDEHVTQPFFATKPSHPLNLQARRPDLWTLELTCENTNKPIPYLVIINEILENAVARDAGFAGDFGDRTAVETKVYKDTLTGAVDSFRQPLNLPFEELRTYLRHFERTLADLAEAGNATGDVLARLRLALPPKDYLLITQVNDGLPFLRRIYGIQFNESGGAIKRFDAQELLKPMGVDRDELGELIASRFVTADGAVHISIKGEKRSADSIQNDIENIEGLTRASLDRMHRFVRLWRASGWRIGELDLILTHLKEAGIGSGVDASVVQAVACIHRLQSKHNISVEELTALWSALPQHAILRSAPGVRTDNEDGEFAYPQTESPLARFTVSLFDRLFNQDRFLETGGSYPQAAVLFLHPALASAPPANVDPNLHRLQAGTGTDDDELLQLIVGLARPLGIDLSSGNDDDKKFSLNVRNLSLLYRHARLARLLKVGIPELFALCSLAPEIGMAHVDGMSDLDALLDLYSWWKTTKWTLGQLVQIIRPGLPAMLTSAGPVAGTTGGESVTYTSTVYGETRPAETITLGVNADLAAVIADWNGQAQHTAAFRSDAFGVEDATGTHLSVRCKAGTGPDSKLEITGDSAAIFSAAPPQAVIGSDITPGLNAQDGTSPDDLAKELVEQVQQSDTLVFADTVFAQLRPLAPVATSGAPLPATAGGETVAYTPVLNGKSEAVETIVLAANPTLEEVVADWNSKATFTRAYQSDAAGKETGSGTHLSITTKDGSGSNTRLSITTDSGAIFAGAVPKEVRGAEITEAQSREIVAANAAILEPVSTEGRYRISAGFDPSSAIAVPAGVDQAMKPFLHDTLRAYHSKAVLLALLPSRVGVTPSAAPELITMLGADLNADIYFKELRGDVVPAQTIADLIPSLQRLGALFAQEGVFGADNLEFIRTNAALFGIDEFNRIGTPSVRRIELFRKLVDTWLARSEPIPDIKGVLLAFGPAARFENADQDDLAALLGCDVGLVQSLQANLSLSTTLFEVLEELLAALELALVIGIGGSALKLAQSADYGDLSEASSALQAAFRAKYEDEAEWEKKVEPFNDALLSRKRDGLVAYLVHSGAPQFDEVNDLYHYYLLDVEVEGCMRTSRVAAAIDSVQLYVHRCLMNLEETSPGDADPVHVLPQSIPDDEWDWRKNYRVWEANRKVFLYPENYIEPELRGNKTPLFKTLEEELLSKEITDESILEAYGGYLRGLDELAHLTIAGSYHEKDEATRHDVLHLLGVTSDDPPVYYYRRVEDAHYGAVSDERATHWGAWEKLNIQVPVRKVAPLIHNAQLYVFWIRYVTKAQNKVKNGESKFTGYQHKAYIEFTRRKLDGSWTTPQKVRLDEGPFGPSSFPRSYQDDGVVLDPIVPKTSTAIEILWFDFTFYSNFEPLYDSKTHEIPKDDYTLKGFQWDQLYPASGEDMYIRGVNFQMWSPLDLYRLRIGPQIVYSQSVEDEGVPWLNPAILVIIWMLTGGDFDLTSLLPPLLVWSRKSGESRELHSTPSLLPCFDTYTYATLLLDVARFTQYQQPLAAVDPAGSPGVWTGPQWDKVITDYLANVPKINKIANIPGDASLDVVNGSVGDVVVQTSRDAFYLQGEVRGDGKYHLRRLNTSLSEDIADVLFNRGLEELLATKTQLGFKEHSTGLSIDGGKVNDATKTGDIDFNGPMGTYLREVFFHIPFLIANHLNSQGKYEEAQRWYNYIFDPTASETIQGLPAGLSEEERRRRELDRNWRYREFRGLTLESLLAQLTNEVAIEEYKRDPFNPHAIARLRTSAYQKAIVMKYVDNLLDWGDDLFIKAFAQQNAEYLRQATLKYVTAQEILGDRPALLGDCGEGKLTPKIFPRIKDELADDSEFLMEMESIIVRRYRSATNAKLKSKLVAVNAEHAALAIKESYLLAKAPAAAAPAAEIRPTKENVLKLVSSAPADMKEAAARMTLADAAVVASGAKSKKKAVTAVDPFDRFAHKKPRWLPDWGLSFVREVSPIFCVPGNERMLKHWDRVEDRLYKLRHCQDIEGVVRLLPLFAPEIDPGLLVGGRAAGLSLEDILAASAGSLPPYRFRYLVDKAKSFASIVQSFGAALLSAIEKRDAEELAKLRNVHQKNLLALTSEVKRNELKIAEESVQIVTRRQAAAQYREGYYEGLISSGLSDKERMQVNFHKLAAGLKVVAGVLNTVGAITYLVPQCGSPFSMKYGGKEIGDSGTTWSEVLSAAASVFEATGTYTGLGASYQRRSQGWGHQKELAEHDLKSIEKELAVAELKKSIATRSLELHDKAKEQHDEIMEFFGDKFSNLGLYTHLSRTLQQLHREAYNNAMAIARLAEQAYRFERPGDTSVFVGGEWDASRSGLLAGERLLMALHNMDKRFVETNTRTAEINQSFSLVQIAPQAIIDLKETGHCEFAIPEFYFDMFYPGQYRRRVRAVRLTIPCITGPYTNISAKLTLLRSYIRKEATLGAAHLLEVPTMGRSSVSTSTGQGDAGVFELSFRDERYMPFEGAGAVSEWRLELPSSFRPFDYQSINDVFINISYTAEEDGVMRQQVESLSAAAEGALLDYLSNNQLTRVFSLRQEFSNAYNRLVEAAAGTPVTIEITDRHFPLFLQGRALTVAKATAVLGVVDRGSVGAFAMTVNGTPVNGFSNPTDPARPGDVLGGLPTKSIGAAFAAGIKKQHTIVVDAAGNLAAAPGAGPLLGQDKIRDILMVVEYRL
jgi:hypothetical protein